MKIQIPGGKLTRKYINQLARELNSKERTDETKELEERVLKEFMKQKSIKQKKEKFYDIIQDDEGNWVTNPPIEYS